jgi:hypothetical protein
MELPTKHCAICGERIERGNDIKRFGKHFDSEEHAEQYAKMTGEKNQPSPEEHNHSGGCCC